MATELLMEISQDERERAIMRSRRMYETDQINAILVAEDRGMTKGKAEGKAEGEAIGAAKVLELLNQGVPVDEIKKRLGL
jgi:predicted transposase YdaD